CILHTYVSIKYLSTTWSFWRHLGAFGAQKGVFRVVIGRARHGATSPERHHQVARISHPSRSDLPKRHPEVARVSMARRHEAKPGATSQSDPLRSLPKAGATCRSDMPRLSEYLHSQCFDIPQNWFDNLLYYSICLRSLENS
ncbi:hypothetical protein IGI04_038263, partial [Brassica rapa subsp. trilocularis]